MIKEETYRKNLGIIDKELDCGNIAKARRMIKEEIFMSANDGGEKC